MGVLQAALLLSSVGHLSEKFVSKMSKFVFRKSFCKTLLNRSGSVLALPVLVTFESLYKKITELSGVIRANRFANRANRVIHANRKFESFRRIGLTRYKKGMIRANRFVRIALRIARATKSLQFEAYALVCEPPLRFSQYKHQRFPE